MPSSELQLPTVTSRKPGEHYLRTRQGQLAKPHMKRRFLFYLSRGLSVTRAAEQCEIAPATAYNWKNADPEFAEQWRFAYQEGVDRIDDELTRRGIEGVLRPVFYKGKVVDYIREYSDTCLVTLARGKKPHVYGRDVKEISGPGGGPIPTITLDMSLSEAQEIYRRLLRKPG